MIADQDSSRPKGRESSPNSIQSWRAGANSCGCGNGCAARCHLFLQQIGPCRFGCLPRIVAGSSCGVEFNQAVGELLHRTMEALALIQDLKSVSPGEGAQASGTKQLIG